MIIFHRGKHRPKTSNKINPILKQRARMSKKLIQESLETIKSKHYLILQLFQIITSTQYIHEIHTKHKPSNQHFYNSL
jgi:hypothetical protein